MYMFPASTPYGVTHIENYVCASSRKSSSLRATREETWAFEFRPTSCGFLEFVHWITHGLTALQGRCREAIRKRGGNSWLANKTCLDVQLDLTALSCWPLVHASRLSQEGLWLSVSTCVLWLKACQCITVPLRSGQYTFSVSLSETY